MEQIKVDLDIPTAQTLDVFYPNEKLIQSSYQIKYRFDEARQIIRVEFVLHADQKIPFIMDYRTTIFMLNNQDPISDKTISAIIKKLHADIIGDAVFFSITNYRVKLDLVLFKKFINENKPHIIRSDELDMNEFIPVYDRPYTTKRKVAVKK